MIRGSAVKEFREIAKRDDLALVRLQMEPPPGGPKNHSKIEFLGAVSWEMYEKARALFVELVAADSLEAP